MPITDVLQMMGRAGRPQFDEQGVAVVLVLSSYFILQQLLFWYKRRIGF